MLIFCLLFIEIVSILGRLKIFLDNGSKNICTHFEPEAEKHCNKIGLHDDLKILLLLGDCTFYTNADIFEK